ncbi:MAG TPA: hypothetical protein VH599_09860 [Ktedonobacterales bacterium]|jgi:hypothetical protein
MRRKPRALVLALCCVALFACTVQAATDPPDPIKVTPADTSSGTLDVEVTILENQDATDHKTTITLSFSTTAIDEQNTALFNNPNEEVICNTVKQQLAVSVSHVLHVPRGDYSCVYSGNKNGVALPYVRMFVIRARSELSPQLPTVTRDGFSIEYTPDSDGMCTLLGKAEDKAQDPPVQGKQVPSNLGVYSGPSTSGLRGEGDVFLTRTCIWQNLPSAFARMEVTYVSLASVEVEWTR